MAQANPANAGSVSGGGAFVTGGFLPTATATAMGGFTFTNCAKHCSPNNTFLTLATNLTLLANFAATLTTHTVVAQANPANAGSVSGGGYFVTGSSAVDGQHPLPTAASPSPTGRRSG